LRWILSRTSLRLHARLLEAIMLVGGTSLLAAERVRGR